MAKTKRKPDKPRKDFPLGAANNGQWQKKIKGRIYYFGVWEKPDDAETEYLRVREFLQAGRRPPSIEATGLQMSDLCNRFLNAKQASVASGELSPRTFQSYHAAAAELLSHIGAGRLVADCSPEDFTSFRVKVATTRGPHGVSKLVTETRTLFKFAFDNQLIEKPIIFGPQFTRATAKSVRLHRARQQNEHGLKMLEAAEIRSLLDAASPPMKAGRQRRGTAADTKHPQIEGDTRFLRQINVQWTTICGRMLGSIAGAFQTRLLLWQQAPLR